MEVTDLSFITASHGTYFIADTSGHTINFAGIYVTADSTEIDTVLDVDGNDITTDLGLGAGVLIPKGTLITSMGDYMTSITLGAGSCNLILA